MTKKTRIRVARIAAGAVIAAGASLTAAGAASALEIGIGAGVGDTGVNLGVSVQGDDDEIDPCDIGTGPDCETEEPG
ncbi:hypothetical protein AB0E06_13165, partial [Streptomyces sp. NPDC048109]